MKLDQFTAKVSAAISAQREALTAISAKRSAAQNVLVTFISAPSAKALPDAIHARHDLDALERIMADIPSAERSEADLRDRLTALHADELADELSAQITARSAGRAAFRKRTGEAIARLAERIATDETLDQKALYQAELERVGLDNAIQEADRRANDAQRAIGTLRATPTFHALEEAKGLVSNVTF